MFSLINYREADGNIIRFEAHTKLDSTVKLAQEYAKNPDYPDRYVVFTDKLKKHDKSAKKKNEEQEVEHGVFMSCILRPSIFPSQASLLSLMAAVAVASALNEHTEKSIGIGWIGDTYCDGTKIGSVSIEGKLDDFTSYEYIIINFNIKISKENFPPRLKDMVKKVFEAENTSLNMIIARTILTNFFKHYQNLKAPQKFMQEYNDMFLFRGKKVKYYNGEKWKKRKIVGVDAKTGQLILYGKAKNQHISSAAQIQNPKKVR
jgi:BirA family biotin operon repressor/biotin-[acetyl-CoA-carboxylase] ligase